jgi:hypothetical protein
MMKNLKVVVMLFLAATMLSIGCNKNDDKKDDPPSGNFKGSVSLTIDGTLHNELQSDVAEINEGVVFLIKNSTDGSTFEMVIANVPAIGTTFTFTMNPSEDSPALIATDGPVPNTIGLIAVSGTLQRTSEKNYQIDAAMIDITDPTVNYPIVGNVTVGVINTH